MKQKTEQEAYLTLASLCANAEHCQWEMLEKMRRWELPEEAQARVMQRLVGERYVDDERYAHAFVKGKLNYNKWGRRKIAQALWQKHIDEAVRQRVLDEIADEDYVLVLRPLLLNGKLIKFALSRGFTMDIIRQCINVEDEDQFVD